MFSVSLENLFVEPHSFTVTRVEAGGGKRAQRAAWAAAGDGRQTRPGVAARRSLPLRKDCLPESSAGALWRFAPLVKGQVLGYSRRNSLSVEAAAT